MADQTTKNFAVDAIPHLEPQAAISSLASPSEVALVSIAISMKRIADSMGNKDIAEEIQRGIWGGAQDALSVWQHR